MSKDSKKERGQHQEEVHDRSWVKSELDGVDSSVVVELRLSA